MFQCRRIRNPFPSVIIDAPRTRYRREDIDTVTRSILVFFVSELPRHVHLSSNNAAPIQHRNYRSSPSHVGSQSRETRRLSANEKDRTIESNGHSSFFEYCRIERVINSFIEINHRKNQFSEPSSEDASNQSTHIRDDRSVERRGKLLVANGSKIENNSIGPCAKNKQ